MVRVLLGSSLMHLSIFLGLRLNVSELFKLSQLSTAPVLIKCFDFFPILILELHDKGPIIRWLRNDIGVFYGDLGEFGGCQRESLEGGSQWRGPRISCLAVHGLKFDEGIIRSVVRGVNLQGCP
jgi:hypothetical protein